MVLESCYAFFILLISGKNAYETLLGGPFHGAFEAGRGTALQLVFPLWHRQRIWLSSEGFPIHSDLRLPKPHPWCLGIRRAVAHLLLPCSSRVRRRQLWTACARGSSFPPYSSMRSPEFMRGMGWDGMGWLGCWHRPAANVSPRWPRGALPTECHGTSLSVYS